MTDVIAADAPTDQADEHGMPVPAAALARLEPLVGDWVLRGQTADATEPNIHGTATYRWLPGGFFLERRAELDFAGMVNVESVELIGYDEETDTFPSQVYASMAPVPLPYTHTLGDDGTMTTSVSYGPLDATFRGRLAADCRSFSGEWTPNPGADPQANAPYEVIAYRAD